MLSYHVIGQSHCSVPPDRKKRELRNWTKLVPKWNPNQKTVQSSFKIGIGNRKPFQQFRHCCFRDCQMEHGFTKHGQLCVLFTLTVHNCEKPWPKIGPLSHFLCFCPTESKIIFICQIELILVPFYSPLKTVIIRNQEEQDGIKICQI